MLIQRSFKLHPCFPYVKFTNVCMYAYELQVICICMYICMYLYMIETLLQNTIIYIYFVAFTYVRIYLTSKVFISNWKLYIFISF